jgi:hypothetical protein
MEAVDATPFADAGTTSMVEGARTGAGAVLFVILYITKLFFSNWRIKNK